MTAGDSHFTSPTERVQRSLSRIWEATPDRELPIDEITVEAGVTCNEAEGAAKSLATQNYVTLDYRPTEVLELTDYGLAYAVAGLPELRMLEHLRGIDPHGTSGCTEAELSELLSEQDLAVAKSWAIKLHWVRYDATTKQYSVDPSSSDFGSCDYDSLVSLHALSKSYGNEIPIGLCAEYLRLSPAAWATSLAGLTKRKVVQPKMKKSLVVKKGSAYSAVVTRATADITKAMLATGEWSQSPLKAYNFDAAGRSPRRGSIQKITQAVSAIRRLFASLGFSEQPTEQHVETALYNFDALWIPQNHPARDIQDTFFMKNPAAADRTRLPLDLAARIGKMQTQGDEESLGWRYPWSLDEACKNILRTHTTAGSARMLEKIGETYKKTGQISEHRFFSIDRVYRNENIDATHLPEFHQIEGMVMGPDISLATLKGIFVSFYGALGIRDLHFAHTYNPYTEPSIEIEGYVPELDRMLEVGNSGIFRPELLKPLGLPSDYTVMAWGLSLERLVMLRWGISDIRETLGPRAGIGK